jgi:hypothetical protein
MSKPIAFPRVRYLRQYSHRCKSCLFQECPFSSAALSTGEQFVSKIRKSSTNDANDIHDL